MMVALRVGSTAVTKADSTADWRVGLTVGWRAQMMAG